MVLLGFVEVLVLEVLLEIVEVFDNRVEFKIVVTMTVVSQRPYAD